jgi:hypothetical protein
MQAGQKKSGTENSVEQLSRRMEVFEGLENAS